MNEVTTVKYTCLDASCVHRASWIEVGSFSQARRWAREHVKHTGHTVRVVSQEIRDFSLDENAAFEEV